MNTALPESTTLLSPLPVLVGPVNKQTFLHDDNLHTSFSYAAGDRNVISKEHLL
jgi:hypothetical protein